MIEDKAILKEAVKGQTIKELSVSQDNTSVDILLQSGKTLIINGMLIPFIDVTPELEVEVRLS